MGYSAQHAHQCPREHTQRRQATVYTGLQNSTTSSEERASADAEGSRLPHREVTD